MTDSEYESDHEQSVSSLSDFDNPDYIEDDDISHPHSGDEREFTDDEDVRYPVPPELLIPRNKYIKEILYNAAGYSEHGVLEKAQVCTAEELRRHVYDNVLDRIACSYHVPDWRIEELVWCEWLLF